jgi:OOP family OmpA-OmpF porin
MTKRFNPTPSLGAVAVAAALAAFAGAASAQTGYVVDSQKNAVRSTYNECVLSGQGGGSNVACPPSTTASSSGAPMRVAASAPAGRAATMQSAASGSTTGSTRGLPGYAVSSDGNVVLSGFGQCVRAGHWVPANAAEPCDRIAVAQVQAPPPPPVAAPAPTPAPAPLAAAPAPAPEPPRPVIQKLTLSTDVLFDFNKAELRDAGRKKLDELIAQVKDADVDEVIAIGHADRIASDDYNQKLSEARAQAVKAYLEEQRIKGQRVTAEGKGESQPVTGDDCRKMGAERASNAKLVACLQPDRRVEIEVLGSRQVAGGAPAAGTGGSAPATGPGGSAPAAGTGATGR